MYQQWLQVIGLIFDGLGFALITLEWFRGYPEMRSKVTLVARNLERAEKIRLQRQIKDTIGSVRCRRSRSPLSGRCCPRRHGPTRLRARPVDHFRKTHVRLFFAGVVAFIAGMVLQLQGLARMLHLPRHYPPVARVANGLLARFVEKRRTQSSSTLVVSVLMSFSNSSGSVGQSPRSSRGSLLMALTQSRPAIGPSL
jgi:hypothetical protein